MTSINAMNVVALVALLLGFAFNIIVAVMSSSLINYVLSGIALLLLARYVRRIGSQDK